MLAMEGKVEMMYPQATKAPPPSLAATKFKDFAKTHNAILKSKDGG